MTHEPSDEGDQGRLIYITPCQMPSAIEIVEFVPEVAISRGSKQMHQYCNHRNAKSNGLGRNAFFLPLRGFEMSG